jgi:hypothetical protein
MLIAAEIAGARKPPAEAKTIKRKNFIPSPSTSESCANLIPRSARDANGAPSGTDLSSGRYIVIENAREFTLVPWHPMLSMNLGVKSAALPAATPSPGRSDVNTTCRCEAD